MANMYGSSNSTNGVMPEKNIEYPWEGYLDLSQQAIKMNGIMKAVKTEAVWYNSYDQNCHHFLIFRRSCLEIDLKPPTDFFEYDEATFAALTSIMDKNNFFKEIAVLIYEFVK